MADPPVGPGANATSWPERVAASAIPTVLGGAAFAVSFSNVRAVARANGTGEWKSWALAASVELLALGAALEVRRRRARGEANVWPWLVLLVGIVATVAANLDTAEAPGWGTVVAVWPALAYLLAASLKATRPATVRTVADRADRDPGHTDQPPADSPPGRPHLVTDDPVATAVRELLSGQPEMSGRAIRAALRERDISFANDKIGPLVNLLRKEVAA